MYRRMPSAKGDNSNFYEILGVFKTSSQDEIKKAYKRAAMINHPDKGGDAEKVCWAFHMIATSKHAFEDYKVRVNFYFLSF